MSAYDERPRVTALLGPTNTGKTYLAIERMLDHESGIIGFPLRLLARENYDRVVRLKGARHVALVTGEEKIVPAAARYFICTVESMPLDRPVDFLAVDEVQMCADPERGHVFTDRLLRARGDRETMFLGADTVRPLIRKLVPGVEFESRARLSRLSYSGPRKISRLPPKSAVVAFSADDVYAIAELIRRQRGGAAVVLGALSPRTRNAQVAMYQAGEVDYLVATDAIGMGLNMDVDHVAFHSLRKFDGRVRRRLSVAELAQIAGRAGRHMADGTFGTVAELGALDPETVEAIESHRFDPVPGALWRNADLSFDTPKALLASLDARPPRPELYRAREADDQHALAALARDPEVAALARHPGAVRLLWDVCQIPDFRKTMAEAHTRLLARIYRHLAVDEGRLPADWVADQMARLDRVDGDIDTLMARIAHVRTWTYVSHRADWLDDTEHWQARARGIEDHLSDALHERLTQRFVDRRAAALNRVKDKAVLIAAVADDGGVMVEGQHVGRIDGFRFVPDAADSGAGRRAMMAAANRALRREIDDRVDRLAGDADDAFALDESADITWRGQRVAKLRRGDSVLAPHIDVAAAGALSADQRERARTRLSRWLETTLADGLGPLIALRDATLAGTARGLAYQLVEGLGSLPRRQLRRMADRLNPEDRRALKKLGVRLGPESVFLPVLVKPKAVRLRALLWSVYAEAPPRPPPAPGLNSVAVEPAVPAAFYEACGYRIVDGRALRVDILDRFAVALLQASKAGPFAVTHEMVSLLGMSVEQTAAAVVALGYQASPSENGPCYRRATRREREGNGAAGAGRSRRQRKPDRDSPFAKLRDIHPVE
jgi:ATP-dependent RNA helicase SUPV3L1/SUV3